VYVVELKKQIARLSLDEAVAIALEAQAVAMRNMASMRLVTMRDLLARCEAELSHTVDEVEW